MFLSVISVHSNWGGGDCLIRRLGQFVDLMEAWQKIRTRVFIPPPMHTISSQNSLKVTTNYYEKKYLLVISKNKKHSSKQVVPITHIGEKGLCCCNFSRFVGGFFSDKVKNCVVKFAFFEPSISRGQ